MPSPLLWSLPLTVGRRFQPDNDELLIPPVGREQRTTATAQAGAVVPGHVPWPMEKLRFVPPLHDGNGCKQMGGRKHPRALPGTARRRLTAGRSLRPPPSGSPPVFRPRKPSDIRILLSHQARNACLLDCVPREWGRGEYGSSSLRFEPRICSKN